MFGQSGQQAWKWSILARRLVHKTTVVFDHSLCKLAPKLCYLVSSITLHCRTVWSVYISLTQKQQPTSLESSQDNQAGLLMPALYCSSVWERVLGQGLAGQSVSLQARVVQDHSSSSYWPYFFGQAFTKNFVGILGLARIQLIFFITDRMVLWFTFLTKTVPITH